MSMATLAYVAEQVRGELIGEDRCFDRVSTDTRSLRAGELFVALRGPRFDGNAYVSQANGRGAAGAVVDTVWPGELSQVRVSDTRLALGRLAEAWRMRFDMPVVAVTGSNGKTTVKEMLTRILEGVGATLSTKGNLNNDIGVPLTLLNLRDAHRFAAIEMGANHAGEIAYLTRLARPTVGIVNNAAAAHLEGFGSLSGVAKAKGELFAGLGESATAVINADDRFAPLWRELAARCKQVLTFGESEDAEYRADSISQEAESESPRLRFMLHTPRGSGTVRLNMIGRHNVLNALAAAAGASAAGVDLDAVIQGLEKAVNVTGRLTLKEGLRGARIIDDSYNANPSSLSSALDFLVQLQGKSWLVLGDMGELGGEATEIHRDIGVDARQLGVERLFTIGALAGSAAQAFGAGARSFEDTQSLIDALRDELQPNVNVLVKASRKMRLEQVVSALTEEKGE